MATIKFIFSLILIAPLFILGIWGIIVFLGALTDDDERKEMFDNWDKEIYNNYMITCPICGSKKVKKISTTNRTISVALTGLASSKIGKQYECDNCNHKW